MGFVQSERGQGPIYIIKRDNQLHLLRRLNQCCKKQINCIGSIEFLRPYPVRTSISLNPSPTLTKKGVLSGSSHWKPLQGVLFKKKDLCHIVHLLQPYNYCRNISKAAHIFLEAFKKFSSFLSWSNIRDI